MKRLIASAMILCLAAAGGCGRESHHPAHGAEKAAPEPAPPTPDTTPIEALRTPAGLVLKFDAPTPVPSPSPAPTP